MLVPAVKLSLPCCALSVAIASSLVLFAQTPPVGHVVIPNPTPRPADLKQELEKDSADHNRQSTISLQNQLHAREIWLESNQILLLTQQLVQELPSGERPTSMAANATKAAAIAKLAKDVQEKMKVH